jgi:hypothetical protein
VTTCRHCGADTTGRCPTCWRRIETISELQGDAEPHRQRILDLDVGRHFGARVTLGFITPARTHFDLCYALLGEPAYDVLPGTQGDPPLAGPWDAVDSDDRTYEGFGRGYTASVPAWCRGTVRFVPTKPGPSSRWCPSGESLRLQAISSGDIVLDVIVEVPAGAPWEEPA